jgi:hypothetical protein
MDWLKHFFDITKQDLKRFLKLSLLMVISIVIGMLFVSFTWGTIPGLVFLALGVLIGLLLTLMFFPWV